MKLHKYHGCVCSNRDPVILRQRFVFKESSWGHTRDGKCRFRGVKLGPPAPSFRAFFREMSRHGRRRPQRNIARRYIDSLVLYKLSLKRQMIESRFIFGLHALAVDRPRGCHGQRLFITNKLCSTRIDSPFFPKMNILILFKNKSNINTSLHCYE